MLFTFILKKKLSHRCLFLLSILFDSLINYNNLQPFYKMHQNSIVLSDCILWVEHMVSYFLLFRLLF